MRSWSPFCWARFRRRCKRFVYCDISWVSSAKRGCCRRVSRKEYCHINSPRLQLDQQDRGQYSVASSKHVFRCARQALGDVRARILA